MKEEELRYVLALQKVKGIGDIQAKKLIAACGTAKNIFTEKKQLLAKINGIGSYILKNLGDASHLKAAENELQLIKKHQLKPLFFLDNDYPENLKNCIDAPILMFQDGTYSFDSTKIISVVGTRRMTNYGRDFCEHMIAELAKYDPIIISGFAYGVDICAHKAALENKLRTVAVLAHGFGTVYPKAHKKYMADMYERGGFLSEFWYDELPYKESFLKRNRIVAGVSQATVVVESANKGGAMVTADIANSYSRDVFALPGRTNDTYSKGCNSLIRDHKAALMASPEDLVAMLGWETKKENKSVQRELFVSLTEEEQIVVDYLKLRKKELLDIIAFDCTIPVFRLASILFQLEMKGVVRPLPGKYFELS